MFRRIEDKQIFFSTKSELKIEGMTYRPSICYKVPALAKKSLEKYAASGKITFYTEPVRFVNGVVQYPKVVAPVTGVASVVRDERIQKSGRKKGK